MIIADCNIIMVSIWWKFLVGVTPDTLAMHVAAEIGSGVHSSLRLMMEIKCVPFSCRLLRNGGV